MTNGYRDLSLWWDSLPDELGYSDRPALSGQLTADVAIVGAGYSGLWTAYYLLKHQPDLKVVVLDAHVAGFGASGRNGGWCSALFPASIDAVAARSSREQAVALHEHLVDAVDEVDHVLHTEDIDADFAKGGTLTLIRSQAQADRAAEELATAEDFGLTPHHTRPLDATQALSHLRATDVQGALFTPDCAAIHPAKLVRGLALAVERLGGIIYELSPVLDIKPGAVEGEGFTVRAPIVVRATEGYTPSLRSFKRQLTPVYSLVTATEPIPDAMWDEIGLKERETFGDYRRLIIYGQRTADNRMVFGGRGAPYHFGSRIAPEFDRDNAIFAELERSLVELFPVLQRTKITHRWGGPLGVPRDWFASVSLDPTTGLGTTGGYVGDGVGVSNLGGRTLADLVLSRSTPRTQLPWVNHTSPQWEPEPLRWIGVNAGLVAMSTSDSIEARTGKQAWPARLASRFTGH